MPSKYRAIILRYTNCSRGLQISMAFNDYATATDHYSLPPALDGKLDAMVQPLLDIGRAF